MSALFVTATGTEVGKTHLVERLLEHCRLCGREVQALKPVVSGFDPDDWADSDSGRLLRALGAPLEAAALEEISPWRFREPLSPDMAAQREARRVPYDALLAYCRRRIGARDGVLLIEGIGGVMVPLDERHTVRDWIVDLQIPALVVGGSYLGAISHALTTLAALEQRRVPTHALVLSESAESPVPLRETAAVISRFSDVPVRLLPRSTTPSQLAELARGLLD